MAKIIEKVNDNCWNNASKIEYNDQVTVYRLDTRATLKDIGPAYWAKASRDSDRVIIVKRKNEIQKLCRSEEMRDARDDVCTIISKWYDRLLIKYNEGLGEEQQLVDVGELFKKFGEFRTNRVHQKANELGLNADDLVVIGKYKKKRNLIVHKNEWNEFNSYYTKEIALRRLQVASEGMSPECKSAVEKCINELFVEA